MVNRRTGRHVLRSWLIALAALLPVTAPAAQAARTTPLVLPSLDESQQALATELNEEELDEVLVEGRKPIRDIQKVRSWIPRLAGQFVVTGSVDLHGNGGSQDLLAVRGRSDCIRFHVHAVQCELNLRWPEVRGPGGEQVLGGISNLSPAIMLYGVADFAVKYMLADSNGIAEDAVGYLLTEDMLVSRSKCVNVPGNCERVVRITADAELKQVEMQIDLEVEYRKAASFTFVMRRVSAPPTNVPEAPL